MPSEGPVPGEGMRGAERCDQSNGALWYVGPITGEPTPHKKG